MVKVIKQIRNGLPLVGVPPYGQIHLHSTGNRNSTAQNEADYMNRKDINSGFYTHVVGNGKIIQVAPVNRGAYDVGGGWNQWGYASIELIESHKTKQEFMRDYKLYIELARQLADEAGVPKKMDRGSVGINTHDYCRRHQPYNATDHVDPYPYLKKWGISESQLRKDIENGLGGTTVAKPKVKNTYWENGSYFEALQDLKTYDKNFKKVDNTVFLKKGSKFPVRNIQVSSTGTTHAFVAGLNNTCVTLAKSHVKKL